MSRAPGHSLPELLIGLALGLSVIATALVAWQAARSIWLTVVAQQQLQHNARIAWQVLQQHIQRAGAAPLVGVTGSLGVALAPPLFNAVSATTGARGDSLSLTHWRVLAPADCQGNSSGSHAVANHQFQRSASSDDLVCKDSHAIGNTFQPLAEGLEDLQLMFAELSTDGQLLQWKSPAQVSAWPRVAAVAVCLRMSHRPSLQTPLATLTGCWGETLRPDGLTRQRWQHVISLRNPPP